MDLTLVKEIEKAKGGTIRVDFWIKSRKYTKRLSIDTIDSVICALNDDSTPFIIVCEYRSRCYKQTGYRRYNDK